MKPEIKPSAPQEKSIFETMLEGMERDIPAAEWEKLPVDGAQNHDHYLYGAPKKSEAKTEADAPLSEAL